MDIKDDKVLSQNEFIALLAELFSRGQALDMVDVSNEREHGNITDGQKFVYDAADAALDIIDLDKLFDNAEEYELAEKYPDFYEFLREQCLLRDSDGHEERVPVEAVADETEEEVSEEIEEEPQLSMRDTVTKNLVEGHHTGKDSFNEKSHKADEFRAKLDEERRVAMEDAARAATAAATITSNEREAAAKAAETLRELQTQRQKEFESRMQSDVSSTEKTEKTEKAERNTNSESALNHIESEKYHESRVEEEKHNESRSLFNNDAYHSSSKENVERLNPNNRAEDITHTQHVGKENANDVSHVVKSPNAEKYCKQKNSSIDYEQENRQKNAEKRNDDRDNIGSRSQEIRHDNGSRSKSGASVHDRYNSEDLHSHAYTSSSGNEEHYSELSPDADAGSDSTYAASYTKTETQRTVDNSFPSSGNCEYEDNIKAQNLPNEDRIAKYEPTSYEAAGQRENKEQHPVSVEEDYHKDISSSGERTYDSNGTSDSRSNKSAGSNAADIFNHQHDSTYNKTYDNEKPEKEPIASEMPVEKKRNGYEQTSYEKTGQMATDERPDSKNDIFNQSQEDIKNRPYEGAKENKQNSSGIYIDGTPGSIKNASDLTKEDKYKPTSYEAAGQREHDEHSTLKPKENNHSNESSYNTADGRTDSKYNVNKAQDSQGIIDDADKSSKLENRVDSIDHSSDRGRNKYVQTSYEAAGQNDYGDRSSVQHVEERTFATENHQHEYVPPLPKARDAQTIAERDTIKVKTNRVVEDKSRDNIISHDNGTRNTHFGQEKSTATETERIQKDNVISGIAAGAAAIAATEIAARADSRNQIINNAEIGKQNKPISHGFTPLNEIQDNGDMLTPSESSAMIRAMNRASGADFISHKEIADSYSIANQTDSETAQILKEISFENNGRRNIQSFGFSNPQFGSNAPSGGNKVDAGIIAGRQGNQVTLIVNDKPKQFTIRSGGTVNVGGLVMNVYQMEGNKAFVGWKGATVNDNVLTTSMNTILTVKKGTNTIINGVGLAIDIKDNVKIFSAKVQEAKAVPMFNSVRAVKEKIKAIQEKRAKEISLGNGMSVVMDDDGGRYGLMPISMAPIVTTAGASDADFMQTGDSFTTNDFALKKRGKGINQILRETEFTKTLNKQGKYLHVFLRKKSYNFMRSIRFTNDDVQILAMNYDRILAMNCSDARLLAKMNKELELKYLGAGKFAEYRNVLRRYGICTDVEKLSQLVISDDMPDEVKKAAMFYTAFCKTHKETAIVLDARERLRKRGITTDVGKLGQLVKNGKLSGEDAILAQAYMSVYTQTRAEIIQKGILNGEFHGKKSRIEDAFLSASIPILMQEHGIPLNKREIRKLLLSGNISPEQLKLIQSYLLNRSAINMMKLAKRLRNQTVSGVKKLKHYANKYMGSDYTMRGLMMFGGVVKAILSSPLKTVRAVKRIRRFGSNVISFGKASAKAASATARAASLAGKATARTAALAGKAVVRGVKTVQERGAKSAAKAGVRALGGKIKNGFKMLKNFRFKMKNGGLSFLKTIVRILQVLMTSLLSILIPIIVAIIVVLLMIFSFLSFIKNTGDEVYYDAGDEDTAEVIQEMVDVLTLCHASFRSALSNQFGGGGGEGGTASGTDSMNAPQMQKGDSSDVEKLYDVTTGTWWNNEGNIDGINWGYTCKTIYDKLNSEGNLKSSGGYAVTKIGDKTVFLVAMGSYWGKDGDVLKVTFNQPIALGNEPASNEIYVLKFDEKAWVDTGYPEQKEGLYGHPFGGHRDFLEFLAKNASSGTNMNGKGYIPQTATNMGNILDNTCDMATVGASGMAASTSVNADILYRQEITQETYRDILNTKTNVYYTFPKEQEQPEGITPTPTPKGYDKSTDEGAVYGFYNNNQELISMVLAMFDFDINANTSVKQTVVNTKDTTGVDDESVKNAFQNGLTDKINADTWRLITYFDENGLDLTNYTIGGYDDLKYSTLVGLFNASHIVTGTKVTEYHQGADGLPVYDKLGKPGDETNVDGMSYQVPIMETYTRDIVNSWGVTVGTYSYTDYKRDEDGDICYETHYTACPGHTKYSAAVITLHFDSLLNIKKWWKVNIYDVDDFDKENPNYESDNPKDDNYKAKSYTLKRTFQYIKKPDFYKGIPGTCDQDSAGTSSSSAGFSPGTMTESQKEVAQKVYNFLTTEMSRKLSPEQAIGVLVNIKRECDFEYTQVEAGGGGGYGLTQWTGGRRDKLVQWCNAHGYKYNTLEGQLKMLENEFTTDTSDWTASIDGFYACTTARQAGEYFIRYYERPASEYLNQRINEMDQDIATVKSILS